MIQLCEYAVAKALMNCADRIDTDVLSSYYLYLLYQSLLFILDRTGRAEDPERMDELAGIVYQSNPDTHEVVMLLCESIHAERVLVQSDTNVKKKVPAIRYSVMTQMTISKTTITAEEDQYTRSSSQKRKVIFTPKIDTSSSKEILDVDTLYEYIRILTSEMRDYAALQFSELPRCESIKTVHYHREEAHPYVL